MKAKLACLGYENETDLKFRNCGLKAEATIQSSSDLSESWQVICTSSIDHDWIRDIAVAEFLDNYCIIPSENYLSRGFLSGLRKMLDGNPDSEVAIAAETAAFASLAIKHHDSRLSQRAKNGYSGLLKSFFATMSKLETANTLQSLTTAVLLGIYEVWNYGV